MGPVATSFTDLAVRSSPPVHSDIERTGSAAAAPPAQSVVEEIRLSGG